MTDQNSIRLLLQRIKAVIDDAHSEIVRLEQENALLRKALHEIRVHKRINTARRKRPRVSSSR